MLSFAVHILDTVVIGCKEWFVSNPLSVSPVGLIERK